MTVVFQIPEDVAQALSARAHSHGLALPEYLQAVVTREAFKEEWISLREAQALTGLQRITLREAIARGELKGKKSGRLWRVRRDGLERWAVSSLASGAARAGKPAQPVSAS